MDVLHPGYCDFWQGRRHGKRVVLVNGLPGSGKTTLAAALAATLGAQLLSKDAVKEAIATILKDPPMAGPLGAIAMDTVWALASAIPATVVIESWWFQPRDLRLAEAGFGVVGAPRAVEIWCDVPGTLRGRGTRPATAPRCTTMPVTWSTTGLNGSHELSRWG